jgi:hypothetical protein
MSRVYISGGITGVSNFKELFKNKQIELEGLGYETVNPAELDYVMPKTATWQEYMSICIPLLKMCDYIVMLENWEKSKGATAELEFANKNGILVLHLNDID